MAGAVKYRVYAISSGSASRQDWIPESTLNDSSDCSCAEWTDTACSADAPAGASCNYCETTNTCADFEHSAANLDIEYQVSCLDQANVESAKSEKAENAGAEDPPATPSPAPGMSLSCVGVDHYNGHSIITVCAEFTNVSGADWSKVTASMGSTPAQTYSYTYDGELQTYLTKTCASFLITQYGSYSGLMGVSTSGGTAVVSWDITVTSAEQACQ